MITFSFFFHLDVKLEKTKQKQTDWYVFLTSAWDYILNGFLVFLVFLYSYLVPPSYLSLCSIFYFSLHACEKS